MLGERPERKAVVVMNCRLVRWLLLALLLTMPGALAATPPAAPAAADAPPFPPGRLAQILAPIALYPDPLLAQILMAATYPLQVVEADRWLQNPGNAGLSGDKLAAALQNLRWDPSVKSLVAFPRILRMMDRDLNWTEALGDALMAQQPAVIDAVQALRRQAQAAGTLNSDANREVSVVKGSVTVQPTNPQIVYVPQYDPGQVYGDWPWQDYLPDESWLEGWPDWGFGYPNGYPVAPGAGRRAGFNWPLHQIDLGAAGRAPIAPEVWQHSPVDRGGTALREPAGGASLSAPDPFTTAPAAPEALRGSPVEVLRGSPAGTLSGSTPTIAPAAARAGGFGPGAFGRRGAWHMARGYRGGFGGFAAGWGRGGGGRERRR
jgi:Protein of unknown function (DUF3300)